MRIRGEGEGKASPLNMRLKTGTHNGAARSASFRSSERTAILGAGPAGLTAAYTLARRGVRAEVFEADAVVGGLARTVVHHGFRFDLGGHRFFTKIAPIERLWSEMLGDEFLTRPRLSRIYYNGKFFDYPLRGKDVVARLGVIESLRCLLSYAAARLRPAKRPPETFEEWVTSRFGKRLYEAFFRSYTQKVWGLPGSEIRSQWAAQRIKDFSLATAIRSMLGLNRNKVTTLIEEFKYPRLGPGQMWEAFREANEEAGIPVHLEHRCVGLHHAGGRVESVVVEQKGEGRRTVAVDSVISTMPLNDLVRALDPPAPADVREAADLLRYRSLCLVAVMTEQKEPFPDNWIYLHDPAVQAGRVQNFGAWSEGMVAPGTTCLGVEYFCFEGDELWEMSEAEVVQLAVDELASVGLLDPALVSGGVRVRVPRAYPVYDGGYESAVARIRDYLTGFSNLQTCGRNGLHRYNNQDHSMWTAILAALNVADDASYDVWSVNAEEVYLEETVAAEARMDDALSEQAQLAARSRATAVVP
jgi:protoporphyrinogen oxidase